MTDTKSVLIAFGTGLGLGVLGGKLYYEKKYRMKVEGATFKSDLEAKKELDAALETKEEVKEEESNPKESSEINKNKNDLSEMAKKVKDENPRVDYSTPAPGEKKVELKEEPVIVEDYELEPEDFGERGEDDYDTVDLLYLADGNLVYENGNLFEPVEQPQLKIGPEALRILKSGNSEDVMYVRNNRLKIDYQIILDDKTLNQVMSEEDDKDDEKQE